MSGRNLKCNQAISEINNNAVKFRELQIEHVGTVVSHIPDTWLCSVLVAL